MRGGKKKAKKKNDPFSHPAAMRGGTKKKKKKVKKKKLQKKVKKSTSIVALSDTLLGTTVATTDVDDMNETGSSTTTTVTTTKTATIRKKKKKKKLKKKVVQKKKKKTISAHPSVPLFEDGNGIHRESLTTITTTKAATTRKKKKKKKRRRRKMMKKKLRRKKVSSFESEASIDYRIRLAFLLKRAPTIEGTVQERELSGFFRAPAASPQMQRDFRGRAQRFAALSKWDHTADVTQKWTRVGVRVRGRTQLALGWLRYVGLVQTAWSGGAEWLGIQLDEPRGHRRHGGCLDGTTYFKCSIDHGVFCRPSSVCRVMGDVVVSRFGGGFGPTEADLVVARAPRQQRLVDSVTADDDDMCAELAAGGDTGVDTAVRTETRQLAGVTEHAAAAARSEAEEDPSSSEDDEDEEDSWRAKDSESDEEEAAEDEDEEGGAVAVCNDDVLNDSAFLDEVLGD